VEQRLETLRRWIPEIPFSVGSSVLKPGGRPEESLRNADEAMYGSKPAATSGRLRSGRRNR